jgi:hypothetical protein
VINPFLPYDEELWVADLNKTHTLLLNKFNLVDHHTLVVTREFEKQEVPLTAADLASTLAVMAVSVPKIGHGALGLPLLVQSLPSAHFIPHHCLDSLPYCP